MIEHIIHIRTSTMKKHLLSFFKGLAIGAANIVPGVSGGTIALITGIFERLIHGIKSFDLLALKLFFKGNFKAFAAHTDLIFLLLVFGGAGTGIYALTFVLDPLLEHQPVYVWSFFFGLILASVYFVGRTVKKWNLNTVMSFILGTLTAVSITMLIPPAVENPALWYLFLCGIVAICSMILPGLSGSFVLILMGNYQLVMVKAVKTLDVSILIPVALGAVFGLMAFSRVLAWVFKAHKNTLISLLTGFILGSLGVLWPWKNEVLQLFEGGKEKVSGYEWFLPSTLNLELFLAIFLMVVGVLTMLVLERVAGK